MKEVIIEKNIEKMLIEYGIIHEESIQVYYPKTRDNESISVKKCDESGVIFLSSSSHMNIQHYEEKEDFNSWSAKNRKSALLKVYEDTQRRISLLENVIRNKRWLDVGTGMGGILDEVQHLADYAAAVEPHNVARKSLKGLGYNVFSSVDKVDVEKFDVITLFHVLEHIIDPHEFLRSLKKLLKPGGKIIIEVPHARDFLLSFLDLDSFKKFTLWSEHLILHTRESLSIFLNKAGFSNIAIKGVQRFPLANHLYWIKEGKPGGHLKWDLLRTNELDEAYANMLNSIDRTDTILAVAYSNN